MPFLSINDSDIFYTDHGSGRPLVLLHGRSASGACWDWHIDRLRDRYRVIAFDSVNHGFSSNSPIDQPEPDRVAELEQLLAALEIERPVLVGQSMGSMTSLRWAARHPSEADALVLAGMGWPIPPVESIGPAPLRDGLWLESRNFNEAWAAKHPRIVAQYSRMRSTATAIETSLRPRVSMPGEWSDPAFGGQLAGIKSAVTLFVGADDFMADPVRSLGATIPHARVIVAQDAHHNAYVQCLDEFVELIDEAIAAVEERV
ncbi:alpha/beta fold hydrolase [Microbacterium sp. RG1]|uniref:alpha/beta fold hydrolase n=1 Tax=Microbacterium sp. RG1 TaxID=2489212 RepID=UPI001375A734|nr:alpha/beta hydrolase [Microbacterium sp. RG1]